jgi:hypothetical protein
MNKKMSQQRVEDGLDKISSTVFASRQANVAEMQADASPQVDFEVGSRFLSAKRTAEIYALRKSCESRA